MSSDDERRSHQRVELPRILVKVTSEERMRNAYLRDLSEGGVFIRTEKPLSVDKKVLVQLLPPGKTETLELPGVVVRVVGEEHATLEAPAGMAVKFEGVTEATQAALQALIAQYKEPATQVELPVNRELELKLQIAVEQLLGLRRSLEAKEVEALEERSRRLETASKLADAVRELAAERAKASFVAAADGQAQPNQELVSARAELEGVRARLAAAESAATSLKEELSVLEQDDATTRKFAEKLGRERQAVTAELERLKGQHAAAVKELEASRISTGAKLGALTEQLERAERELEAARGRAHAAETALEQERIDRHKAQGQAKQLEQTTTELPKLQAALGESERLLQSERGAHERAKAELEDLRAKLTRSKQKERELRELMALAAKGGDEVVVSSPPPVPTETSAPAAGSAPSTKATDDWGAQVSAPEVEVELDS